MSIDLNFPIPEDIEMGNTINTYTYQEKENTSDTLPSNNHDISSITITSQQHTNSFFPQSHPHHQSVQTYTSKNQDIHIQVYQTEVTIRKK